MAGNYKLIAKNSIFLYLRLLIVALVGLITSRLVLQALGVRGYGLYTVVWGLVIMMTFLQNSMMSTSQRFMNIELGRSDLIAQKETFAACLFIHRCIAFLLIFLAETVGLWFLNFIMNIHADEILSANIVFQLATFSFVAKVLNTPYRAAITVHERMDILSYVSIFEIIVTCIVAAGLFYAPYDRVVFYSACLLLLNIALLMAYKKIAERIFEECRGSYNYVNKERVKELLNFSKWIVFGAIGTLGHTHGIGLAINLFYGLAMNAALGISNQVAGVVKQFVTSFMMALSPQIVKNYAHKDLESTRLLVKQGCKMGIFLSSILVIPIFIEAPYLLKFWLSTPPPYTIIFVRLNMVMILFWSLTSPLTMAQWATGNIKTYQILLTTLSLSHVPITLVFFKFGYKAPMALYLYIILTVIMQSCRIWFVCNSVGMKKTAFFSEVILRCGGMIIAASLLPLCLHVLLSPSILTTLIVVVTSVVSLSLLLYYFVLYQYERSYVVSLVRSIVTYCCPIKIGID